MNNKSQEEIEYENEKENNNNKNGNAWLKIGLIFLILFGVFSYKFFKGQIPLEIIQKNNGFNNYLSSSSWNELIERLDNVKEYLIAIIIMSILTYFLIRSNTQWEIEYLKAEEANKAKQEQEDMLKRQNEFEEKLNNIR
jgi:hypothetical protein